MKTYLKTKRILIITFLMGLTLSNAKAQNTQNGGTLLDPNYQNPIPEIIATWINESDPKSKWVFTNTNELKSYYNNQLISTSRFFITHSCDQNSDDNAYFMNVVFVNGGNHCYEVNGVNANNSGILSLTSMDNGKIFVYNKE